MAGIDRPSCPPRAALVVVGVFAFVAALVPLASHVQASPPTPRDAGEAAAREADTAQADSPVVFERRAGATRYETAAEVATARFDAATDVVVASGEAHADALAGAALEGSLGAPVLLVPSELVNGAVPTAITDAIDDLGATTATLLGGTRAVSTGVADYLAAHSTLTTTRRVQGATRFETAEAIADEVSAAPAPAGLSEPAGLSDGNLAFVATGLEFADALAVGPGAYAGPHPILLTGPDELHPAAERGLAASGADTVIILGGDAVVGSAVEEALTDQGYETGRLAGVDRWETATEVADAVADGFGFGVADVGLATGFAFADALASAPYLGEVPAPVVLTPSDRTHDQPLSWFEERACDLDTVHIFGGQGAVRQSVAEAYAEATCPDQQQADASATRGA